MFCSKIVVKYIEYFTHVNFQGRKGIMYNVHGFFILYVGIFLGYNGRNQLDYLKKCILCLIPYLILSETFYRRYKNIWYRLACLSCQIKTTPPILMPHAQFRVTRFLPLLSQWSTGRVQTKFKTGTRSSKFHANFESIKSLLKNSYK
jgi:hypothetical protein